MLSLEEFKQFPFNKQVAYLVAIGTFLANRPYPNHQIYLYHLHDFFAEVWYYGKSHHAVSIRTFCSYRELDDFVNLIKLDLE